MSQSLKGKEKLKKEREKRKMKEKEKNCEKNEEAIKMENTEEKREKEKKKLLNLLCDRPRVQLLRTFPPRERGGPTLLHLFYYLRT